MTAYCVHAAPDEVARPHRVEADGHVDAALLYAERWLHPPGHGGGDEAVTVYVQDEGSGEEHCVRLDLGTGEAGPCG